MKLTEELELVLQRLPELLEDRNGWASLLIDKYPPVIYRVSYKLSGTRTLLLHKLHHCEGDRAFMHSHSWPFAIKVFEGGYEMGIGYSADRAVIPEATFTCIVKPGDVYEMLDENMWHYTKVLGDTAASYSAMLVGPRTRERMAQNNSPLPQMWEEEVFAYFRKAAVLA